MSANQEFFRKQLPEMLKHWVDLDFDPDEWNEVLYLGENLGVYPAVAGAEMRRAAIKKMVSTALDALRARAPKPARLIAERYIEQARRKELASERGQSSENPVKYEQRKALDGLARELARLEDEARRVRIRRIANRLEWEIPAQRFGQAHKEIEALAALRDHAVVALVGMGGLGKTSLADALVRALSTRPDFADIVWASARTSYFEPADGHVHEAERVPVLNLEQLAVEIAGPLGIVDAHLLAPQSCLAAVRERLKDKPILVVVDNLESIQNFGVLAPELLRLAGPSKFLLTSRQTVPGLAGVQIVRMDELSEVDVVTLVRHVAQQSGAADLAAAGDGDLRVVYRFTGGNPLAVKLIAGQAVWFPLQRLLEDLREARSASADELYRYVYWRSWRALSDAGRDLLRMMPLVASTNGADFDYLLAGSGLAEADARRALVELINASLVEKIGAVQAPRYRIHRLTETFLTREVLGWRPDDEPDGDAADPGEAAGPDGAD
jgi:hypothetical protein